MNDFSGLLNSLPQGFGLAGVLVFGVALLLLSALVAAWIARDACARGLAAPWAWTIAAAFQPLVVLLVYLFSRETLSAHAEPAARDAPRTI